MDSASVLARIKSFGFRSGFANCHVAGLHSLVIAERLNSSVGMLRIFYASDECTALRDFLNPGSAPGSPEFSVLPHNHRQSLSLYMLFGAAINWDIEVHDGEGGFEWEFGSAILEGQFSLRKKRSVRMDITQRRIPKSGLALNASRIHSVTAEPGSAWLVDEGELSGELRTNCYSLQRHPTLSSEGLYIRLTDIELELLAADVVKRSEAAL